MFRKEVKPSDGLQIGQWNGPRTLTRDIDLLNTEDLKKDKFTVYIWNWVNVLMQVNLIKELIFVKSHPRIKKLKTWYVNSSSIWLCHSSPCSRLNPQTKAFDQYNFLQSHHPHWPKSSLSASVKHRTEKWILHKPPIATLKTPHWVLMQTCRLQDWRGGVAHSSQKDRVSCWWGHIFAVWDKEKLKEPSRGVRGTQIIFTSLEI